MTRMTTAADKRTLRVQLQEVVDRRGALAIAELGKQLPFEAKRLFAIHDVPPGSLRGGHAHRAQEQFIIMIAGKCTVVVDDGTVRTEEALATPAEALYVPPGIWIELKDFSAGAACVVLASDLYDETDYIRDYREFCISK
jgi:dTDP-4-dehydrorhamnose 3,5-epimerase-like enzyme